VSLSHADGLAALCRQSNQTTLAQEMKMMFLKTSLRSIVIAVVLALSISVAYAHVTVQPIQSSAGSLETYTLRVPTEKFVPTTGIEIEFPAMLKVTSFEHKPEWKTEEKKDSSGNIVAVLLTGTIPTGESSTFKFTARNPNEEGKLPLKVIQKYQDGDKSEWTGAAGTRSPAPVIEIKKAATGTGK
jgi:uncharacterized protein YcnI